MRHTRRDFLKAGAAAAGAMAIGIQGCAKGDQATPAPAPAPAAPPAPLKILVLGGTGFIGPHMVRRAVERGHTVSLFNRGKSNESLFPNLETLIGDRDGQLQALEGKQWDAIIDTSGYIPRHVRDSANLLAKGGAKQYLFISSVSAYASFDKVGITEDDPGGTTADTASEKVTGDTYGPYKVLAEKAVQQAFPTGAIVVRPGYIVGPGDSTDRWTYWPLRVAAGGEMIAPGETSNPIEIIDARDLAEFVVHLLEQKTTGTFNAVGPAKPIPMGEMLDKLKAATNASTTFTWVDPAWLEAQKVMFPIWNAPTGKYAHLHSVSNARAVAAGLTYRPFEVTARETIEWWNGLPEDRRNAMVSGLRHPPALPPAPTSLAKQMEEEKKILAAWKSRSA